MNGLLRRLASFFQGHIWIEDRAISLNGRWAVLAGLWWPSCTCRRCGAKQEPINERYADERGWWKA